MLGLKMISIEDLKYVMTRHTLDYLFDLERNRNVFIYLKWSDVIEEGGKYLASAHFYDNHNNNYVMSRYMEKEGDKEAVTKRIDGAIASMVESLVAKMSEIG